MNEQENNIQFLTIRVRILLINRLQEINPESANEPKDKKDVHL